MSEKVNPPQVHVAKREHAYKVEQSKKLASKKSIFENHKELKYLSVKKKKPSKANQEVSAEKLSESGLRKKKPVVSTYEQKTEELQPEKPIREVRKEQRVIERPVIGDSPIVRDESIQLKRQFPLAQKKAMHENAFLERVVPANTQAKPKIASPEKLVPVIQEFLAKTENAPQIYAVDQASQPLGRVDAGSLDLGTSVNKDNSGKSFQSWENKEEKGVELDYQSESGKEYKIKLSRNEQDEIKLNIESDNPSWLQSEIDQIKRLLREAGFQNTEISYV